MRVSIVCVGHKMPSWIQSGFGEYVKLVQTLAPQEAGKGQAK